MAKYIVPPKSMPIVKCKNCGALYVPEKSGWTSRVYESCPICKYEDNCKDQRIPLWKYNLIKWFRGGFKNERHN